MRGLEKIVGSVAVVALAVALTPSAASANLLGNPGFEIEDAGGPSTNADVWVEFADTSPPPGTAIRENTMPRNGSWDFIMQTQADNSGFAGAFQEVAVNAGDSYTFSVWAKVDDLADGVAGVDDSGDLNSEARIRMEWRDSGGEISRDQVNITSTITSSYQLFQVSGVAPAGALTVRTTLALSGNDDLFYYDDASLVPEPASLALLGLGGLAVLRRRA